MYPSFVLGRWGIFYSCAKKVKLQASSMFLRTKVIEKTPWETKIPLPGRENLHPRRETPRYQRHIPGAAVSKKYWVIGKRFDFEVPLW